MAETSGLGGVLGAVVVVGATSHLLKKTRKLNVKQRKGRLKK